MSEKIDFLDAINLTQSEIKCDMNKFIKYGVFNNCIVISDGATSLGDIRITFADKYKVFDKDIDLDKLSSVENEKYINKLEEFENKNHEKYLQAKKECCYEFTKDEFGDSGIWKWGLTIRLDCNVHKRVVPIKIEKCDVNTKKAMFASYENALNFVLKWENEILKDEEAMIY